MTLSFDDRAPAGLSRRELLKIAWVLGAGAVARPLDGVRLLAAPAFAAYPFTLGVASGDPLPDGVVLLDAAGAEAPRGRRDADGERRGRLGSGARPGVPDDRTHRDDARAA